MGYPMKITSYQEVEAKEAESSFKLKIRWLNNDGSKKFAVRYIEIEPSGYSPHHSHPWEHEIFVLEGSGTAVGEKGMQSISVGDLISIPGEEIHQIKNTGKSALKILCMIPKS